MSLDPVGLSGLIIALVALVIALFQLFQALFATAEGYRNCKPSIVGRWGEHPRTRRRLVKSELRFETVYTVPLISTDLESLGKQESFSIDGSVRSREKSNCPILDDAPPEMVTWLSFIDQLHRLGASYHAAKLFPTPMASSSEKHSESFSTYGPFLSSMERSWDFTSSDINKPLAISNVGSIAVLIRRLGMTWTQFQPADYLLRAEGNGMTVTSVNIRAVGTILEFSRVEREPKEVARAELYIPGHVVDKLGFGIVTTWYSEPLSRKFGDTLFGNIPEHFIRLGTPEDCIHTMTLLCGEGAATEKVRTNLQRGQWMPGFSDIIPFASPLMYKKGTGINRIPKPAHYSIGLTKYTQAFLVFRDRLDGFLKVNEGKLAPITVYGDDADFFKAVEQAPTQANLVRRWYDQLKKVGGWDDDSRAKTKNDEKIANLDLIYDKAEKAENWLHQAMTRDKDPLNYEDLIRCHIERAVFYKDEALKRVGTKDAGPIPKGANMSGDGPWLTQGMHKYCDWIMDYENHDHIFWLMKKRGYTGDPLFLAEAWFTMMFRAFCWQRLHYAVEGKRVGSSYWNSRLPIYIT